MTQRTQRLLEQQKKKRETSIRLLENPKQSHVLGDSFWDRTPDEEKEEEKFSKTEKRSVRGRGRGRPRKNTKEMEKGNRKGPSMKPCDRKETIRRDVEQKVMEKREPGKGTGKEDEDEEEEKEKEKEKTE
eukprot:CAMPEP_0113876096 /NCGR_PEP_ID=MMETSP0780_2-20120614/5297_1 /TAXON_ID=652834 /ORGANISM="Palpitomonas bilix" /LENGTH=129 /DNA_ID=CAMNT_0000862137 /DNA_START=820 /DNA_END=1206 /DNA_ORIENTATION=+ /assembly_acc=CAM_ASM_000599